MTMRRGSRRRFSSSRPRSRTEWAVAQIAPATVGPGVTSFTDIFQNIGAGKTILRIVGSIRVQSTHATLSCDFVYGVGVKPGAMSNVLNPSDSSFPWMHWRRGAALPASDSGQARDVDIRSKRRVRDEHDDLQFIIENNDSAQSLEYVFGFRFLVRLP